MPTDTHVDSQITQIQQHTETQNPSPPKQRAKHFHREAMFPQLVQYLGLPNTSTVVPFNILNATVAYAVEDIVLGDLMRNKNVSFWSCLSPLLSLAFSFSCFSPLLLVSQVD